jgi:hypothetical protein
MQKNSINAEKFQKFRKKSESITVSCQISQIFYDKCILQESEVIPKSSQNDSFSKKVPQML